jgi:hemoglobin-like flavoprotein
MALDPQVLRTSFELVIERQPELTTRFYEILFDRYPQVRALFGTDTTHQSKMLASALVAVMDNLEDASWLSSTLTAMGRKHVQYGVTNEMYDWVGASLLATLAEVAGRDWTPALEAQWTEAYGAIAGLMQQGAREVEAAE